MQARTVLDRLAADLSTAMITGGATIVFNDETFRTRKPNGVPVPLSNAGPLSLTSGQCSGLLASGASISTENATSAATVPTDWTLPSDLQKGPLLDRSEPVGRFTVGTDFAGPVEAMGDELAAADRPIKESREAVVRALADSGTTQKLEFFGGHCLSIRTRCWGNIYVIWREPDLESHLPSTGSLLRPSIKRQKRFRNK